MSNIIIRRFIGKDLDQFIPGIVHIFRDDEVVPWHRHDECVAWVTKRAERGSYITVAYDGNKIVGYSEWNETNDNGKKILYLSIMQVDCNLRGRGIGTAMLTDGEKYAKSIGASYLRTIPEDERSHKFYRKYGFIDTDTIYCFVCSTLAGLSLPDGGPDPLTLDVVRTYEFIFGLSQSSGRFMYEVANHDPEISEYTAKTVNCPDGHLQFRHKKGSKTALVLYWSNTAPTTETVSAILLLGYAEGFDELEFYFRSKYKNLFAGYLNIINDDMEGKSTEVEKRISS